MEHRCQRPELTPPSPIRIQSKDLPERSAQKASSVSPAHFRSALVRARRLLDATASSSSDHSPTRSSPRASTAATASGPAAVGAGPSVDPLSPFSTPKKKYKYSSGIDVSDLLRSGSAPGSGSRHTPAHASPLRNSTTAREGEGDGEKTPTKRTKFRDPHDEPQGIDLANLDVEPGPSRPTPPSKRRRGDDLSAFMSLRPGSSPSHPISTTSKENEGDLPEEEKEYLRSIRQKRNGSANGNGHGRRPRAKQIERRDWTCRETRWGSEATHERNRIVLDQVRAPPPCPCFLLLPSLPGSMQTQDADWEQVMERLPTWLEDHGRPPISDTPAGAAPQLVDILLGPTRS